MHNPATVLHVLGHDVALRYFAVPGGAENTGMAEPVLNLRVVVFGVRHVDSDRVLEHKTMVFVGRQPGPTSEDCKP